MKWDELKPKFREAVLHRGPDESLKDVADSIPMAKSTLCELMDPDGTVTPKRTTQAVIERFVADRSGSGLPRPDESEE